MQRGFYLPVEDEKNEIPAKFEKACKYFGTKPNLSLSSHMRNLVAKHEEIIKSKSNK